MSFVIFVMGHFFAPSTKHDYTSVDYWGAIRDTDNIERFNWCQYAFDALIEGIRKLQAELKVASQTNNLMGCHPFLQIFLLDNLDMGIWNQAHNVVPRAQLFAAGKIKRMINMISDTKDGQTVYIPPPVRHATALSYTRHNHAPIEPEVHWKTPAWKKAKGTHMDTGSCTKEVITKGLHLQPPPKRSPKETATPELYVVQMISSVSSTRTIPKWPEHRSGVHSSSTTQRGCT